MMDHNTVGVANELRRNGLLHIFLSVVAQSMPEERREETDRANQYVRRAVEFIQRNYCNPIRVTDVADYVCVNRSYLYTLFQKSLGMSPQQFLAAYRLTKAAEMLMVPHLPVESIALSCGYQDPLVFSKAFRQMKGVSPTMYRKQIQQDEKPRQPGALKTGRGVYLQSRQARAGRGAVTAVLRGCVGHDKT